MTSNSYYEPMQERRERLAREAQLPSRGPAQRLSAYYFGFDETGVPEVDAILAAVAAAGKGYHHTNGWTEDNLGGPEHPTYVELIQAMADRAAAAFRAKEKQG